MNKQDFNQLGGFPLETDTLDWMQEAYSIFNALGNVIGNYAIISGCTVNGTTVSDGVVFVDGEIFKFVGGTAQTNVRMLATSDKKIFENGDENTVHSERYFTFASGTGAIPWANFKRPDSLINLSSRILPAGTNPQLFTGTEAEIPEGWELYLPMKGQFVVGYDPANPDYNAVGKTGGAKEVQLTEGQLPKHTPTGSTDSAGNHSHTMFFDELPTGTTYNPGYDGGNNKYESDVTKTTSAAGAHSHNMSMNEIGNDEGHENRPPYYVLAYIIYVGL